MIGQAVQLLEGNRLQNNIQKEKITDTEVVLVDDILQALLKFDEITTSTLLNEVFRDIFNEKVVTSIILQVANKLLSLKIIMRLQCHNSNMLYQFLQTRLG